MKAAHLQAASGGTGAGPLAHGGPVTPDGAWSLDPPALAALAATALALVLLVRAVRARPPGVAAGATGRLIGLCAGVAVVVVAVLPPLHGLADTLFSAHMVQHLLLVTVGAPLIVRGLPLVHGRRHRRPVPWWSLLGATAALVVVFTGWHVPGLYELAVRQPAVHAVEHLTMLAAALVFWAAAATSVAAGRDLFAVGAIGVSGLAGVALGALLALSSRAWYGVHAEGAAAWGLDPLVDQQLGGMIMWVPGGAANLAAATLVVLRFLRRHEDPSARLPVPPLIPPAPYPRSAMPGFDETHRPSGASSEHGR